MEAGTGLGGHSTGKDEIASDSFNLFPENDIENSIQVVSSVVIRPVNTTTSKGPFNFEVPSDPIKFTNAESFRLHGRMKIVKQDGGNLTNEKVGTVNNIFHSLWSKVVVNINDVAINDPTNSWYAYKAYFENHLSYSKGTKTNLLDYRGYYNDTCQKFDDVRKLVGSTYTKSLNEYSNGQIVSYYLTPYILLSLGS